MTKKRKIAIAYLAAVPAVLLVAFFQLTALFRVARSEQSMAAATAVLRQCGVIMDHLTTTAADSERYRAGGRGDKQALQRDIVQVRSALRQLGELTRNNASAHSQFQRLAPLIENQITSFEDAAYAGTGVSASRHTGAEEGSDEALDDTAAEIARIETAQNIRMQQETAEGARDARVATRAIMFGGGLVMWLVGVAALLLFHDEKARTWTGVEQKVHTHILESLPFSVCLTTHSGIILYANPAAEELFDHAPGDLVGSNVACLHAPGGSDDQRTVEEIFDSLVADQVWSGDLRIRKKEGSFVETATWIVNMGAAGRLYRVFIHQPPCRVLA